MQTVMSSFSSSEFSHYDPYQLSLISDDFLPKASSEIKAGDLSKPGFYFSPEDKAGNIYEIMKNDFRITEFTVVDNGIAVGFLTRTELNEILGGQYGFSLFSKHDIGEIMKKDFLSVDYHTPIDQVSRLAMQRPFDRLYNPIVVKLEEQYYGIITVKDLLDTSTKIALAERDDIALMRDNLKIGIFFMDRNFIIQNQYSRFLVELFSQDHLGGKNFVDLLAPSITPKESEAIKDYFNMIFEGSYDQSMLDDINPLKELRYISVKNKKVFRCGFAAIQKNYRDKFVLVSVYDITAETELQKQLQEEESKRNEEMKTVFELIQVEPSVYKDFVDDMEHEFKQINNTLNNNLLSTHEALVNIYQSLHAIKSNAFTLEQNVFGNKVHKLESKIKLLCEQDDIPYNETSNLATDIEKLIQEKDKFKQIRKRLNSQKLNENLEGKNQIQHILLKSLAQTVRKVSADMGKDVKFTAEKISNTAIRKGPRRIIKEVLIQLIRNSVVHGIELPEERIAAGKSKTGHIKLYIKIKDNKIHIRLHDDGRGINYKKISRKALQLNLIKPEDRKNKKELLKVIFSPGFSTAEKEGIHGGRGIGLNLVNDKVNENKGSIKVYSRHGKGAMFHIILPVL